MSDKEKKRLLEAWGRLLEADRKSLLDFAGFLADRAEAEGRMEPVPEEPLGLPRPAEESAAAGLKRLKKNYPMIEADGRLLGEASQVLMKVVLGTPDREVVDEMEKLFAKRFAEWRAGREKS